MNLNIEGTKHEKAVLVILSYVAGFTAGFIVFGVTQTPSLQSATVYPVEEIAVAPEMLPEAVPSEEIVESPEMTEQVMYKDGRLMANVNGASVLLSAQIKTVDEETAKAFANQGVHEVIPQYLASDDGNFIYYCEQHAGEDTCINFVYNVTDQVIQYVTVDGVKLRSTPAEAEQADWQGSTLTVGTASSMTPSTPWKLTSAQ